MAKKKTKKKSSKEDEKKIDLFTCDHTGVLVSHKEVTVYSEGKVARGWVRHKAGRKYEYQSICLGLIEKGKQINVDHAKGELICLGYWPIEDVMDLLPKKILDKASKLLADKYKLDLK